MKKLQNKVIILCIICCSCGNDYLKDSSIIKRKSIIHEYDINGYTPLMASIRNCDYETTKFLIQNNADVNQMKTDESIFSFNCDDRPDTNTPLIICIYEYNLFKTYHLQSIEIKNECEKNTKSVCREYDDEIIEYKRKMETYIKILDLLLAEDIDINAGNEYGNTALFFTDDIFIFKKLLMKGANVNHTNNDGETILFYVHDYKTTKFLIDNKADYKIRNKSGRTIIDDLEDFYDEDYINYLKSLK